MTLLLLDTNVISDLLAPQADARSQAIAHHEAGDSLLICQSVYYEVLRGLLWRNATAKLDMLNKRVLPLFEWTELLDVDWQQAARFWADARLKGKQIGDPDLLLAALTYRLKATLVSNDNDFDALPIKRETWHSV